MLDLLHPIPEAKGRIDAPILFYTDLKRTFRTTLIGYLYQVCRYRRVVLLTEELDEETEHLLSDSTLFPGLVGRIRVGQYAPGVDGLVARHRRMSRLAREIVDTWQPSAVFAAGVNLFEHYLRRYAKQRCGAVTIGCIGLLLVRQAGEVPLLLDLHGADTRLPAWIPRRMRLALIRTRRWLAQFAYYVVFPLVAGRCPFFGVNGIYRLDYTRLGNMDVSFVFTRDNQEMLLRDGAPADRVLVIPHPMKPGAADPVWRAYGIEIIKANEHSHILTCFMDIERQWGFLRDNLKPISDDVLYDSRIEVVKALVAALPGWEIRIKPHPMSAASPLYESVSRAIQAISATITWIPPDDPVDRSIEASSAVMGFPPASTAIYSAIMLRPSIPALMADINGELRGDAFIGMAGVVTVKTYQELVSRLSELSTGRWAASAYRHNPGDFETLDQLIVALLPGAATFMETKL